MMEAMRFEFRVKYNGKYYDPGQPVPVDEDRPPEPEESPEPEPEGRPKKRGGKAAVKA